MLTLVITDLVSLVKQAILPAGFFPETAESL